MTIGKIIDVCLESGSLTIAGDDGKRYTADKQALQDMPFDGSLARRRVCFTSHDRNARDVMRYPRSRPGPVESHSVGNRGVIASVSKHYDYCFVSVPGVRRNVFCHRSQFPQSPVIREAWIGRQIEFEQITYDTTGRATITGARLVEVVRS